jgi:hypothetical protein
MFERGVVMKSREVWLHGMPPFEQGWPAVEERGAEFAMATCVLRLGCQVVDRQRLSRRVAADRSINAK